MASRRGVQCFVEPWYPTAARARFEGLDAQEFAASERFSDGDRVCYSLGASLSPVAGLGAGAAEGTAVAGIAAGALPGFPSREELWDFAVGFARARFGGIARDAAQQSKHNKNSAEPSEAADRNSLFEES
jgi:hypothetical protein